MFICCGGTSPNKERIKVKKEKEYGWGKDQQDREENVTRRTGKWMSNG